MFEDALANLIGEVESGVVVAPFEQIHDPQGLIVVFEGPDFGDHRGRELDLAVATVQDLVEHGFAGVAKGRVTEIVSQGDGLDQVLSAAVLLCREHDRGRFRRATRRDPIRRW